MRFKEGLITIAGLLIVLLICFNNIYLTIFGFLFGVIVFVFSVKTLEMAFKWVRKKIKI
jgi:hypothetical protein